MKKGVLIIEDHDSDFELVHRGFRRLENSPPIVRTSGVQDTTKLIEQAAPEELPQLIVLDLRLTDGDGRELLTRFKDHPDWKTIPVLVWSAWGEPSVGESCRRHGAQEYFTKAADVTVARETINRIASHWPSVSLPS